MNEINRENKEDLPISGSFSVPFIFPIKIIDDNLDIKQELNENLIEYTKGSSLNPGEGYQLKENIEITEFIEDYVDLIDIFNRLIAINYIFDIYGSKREFRNGEIFIRNEFKGVGVNNIFWISPDFLIIKGSKKTGVRFKNSFQSIFRRKILIEENYKFDPWFIIWIIWKYRQKEYELDDNFYVDIIWDMKVEGSEPMDIGRKISAEESTDVTKSISILYPLLKRLTPRKLKFSFTLKDFIGTAKINTNGRILIYLTKGVLAEKSKVDQVVLACFFIIKIIKLYEKWKNLAADDKIPPSDFIRNIVQECDEMGLEIATDVMTTLEMYENKKKEELDNNVK